MAKSRVQADSRKHIGAGGALGCRRTRITDNQNDQIARDIVPAPTIRLMGAMLGELNPTRLA